MITRPDSAHSSGAPVALGLCGSPVSPSARAHAGVDQVGDQPKMLAEAVVGVVAAAAGFRGGGELLGLIAGGEHRALDEHQVVRLRAGC